MTECEARGYKVGDKFVVLTEEYPEECKKGSIVSLHVDDNTAMPLFLTQEGEEFWLELDTEVKPYVEKKSTSDSDRKMTPFEAAGYMAEDKFEIIGNSNSHGFEIGEIVVLSVDEGDDVPAFIREGDTTGNDWWWVELKDIRKLEGTVEESNMISSQQLERTKQVYLGSEIVIPCPEGYVFDGVRKLNKGDFQLDLNGMTVDEWKSTYSSHGKYIVLKKVVPETLTLKFERVPGLTIENGLYYTDDYNKEPVKWSIGKVTFQGKANEQIWKCVN